MASPVLYEFPPTRSNRVKWALEEIGIVYDSKIVDFQTMEQNSAAHRKIHPLGHVPAYQTSEFTIHESVAILLQLLDQHPEADLAPVSLGSPERAIYYQWCVFACSELDANLFDFMKHTMHLPQDARNSVIANRARENFDQRATALCDALAGQEYLLGSKFSGADIAIGYDCNWAAYVGVLDDYAVLKTYYQRLQSRPAFQKVFGA